MPNLTPKELAAAHATAKLTAALSLRASNPVTPSGVEVERVVNVVRGASSFVTPSGVEGRHPIVAADTVVDLDGEPLGKPADAAEAAAMLRRLSGREHQVHTAFALATPRGASLDKLGTTSGQAGMTTVVETHTTRVRFHALTDDEIAEYVATGEPMDKAGAYGIQGRAAALVAGIDGDFYTVMGFPLGAFVRTLRRLGFTLPAPNEAR